MVRVSPAARKSKVLSGALNVVAIDPLVLIVLSMLTEVVSADASTPTFSSLGSVAPPDQVIEARLALTVLKLTWVKVSTPAGRGCQLGRAGACGGPRFAGVLGMAMMGWVPGSAGSAGLISTGSGLNAGTSMAPGLVEVVMVTANGAESLLCRLLNLIGWNPCG